ncbi:MAG: MaoC family dehydratase [Sporosarcina sp.]
MIEIQVFVTQQDIENYAEVSGDHNPIHLDEEQAKNHGFSGRIAHGMLIMGKVWSKVSSSIFTPNDFPDKYELDFYSPIHAEDIVALQVVYDADRLQVVGICEGKIVIKGSIIIA